MILFIRPEQAVTSDSMQPAVGKGKGKMHDRAHIISTCTERRARVWFTRVLGQALLCLALYLMAPGDVWGTRHARHSAALTTAAPLHQWQPAAGAPCAEVRPAEGAALGPSAVSPLAAPSGPPSPPPS